MERGSYTAASGGFFQLRRLEVVANNLANANTAGFKRQVVVGEQQRFEDTLAAKMRSIDPYARGDHDRNPGVTNIEIKTDFSPGPVKITGDDFNAALNNPNDFFVVVTANGEQYTRSGEFTLSAEGDLVMSDGARVSGDGGPININQPGARIQPNGNIESRGVGPNPAIAGTLKVVRVANLDSLERVEGSRFRLKRGSAAPEAVQPDLTPGAVEMANVSAISSMVDMINANRAFEMYTKAAITLDAMDTAAINQVGRPR